MMLLNQTALVINKPTVNGYIYSKCVVENAIKNIEELMVVDIDERIPNTPLDRVIGVAKNIRIENGELKVDVKCLPTHKGKQIYKALGSKCVRLSIIAVGNINENNEVTDCDIQHIKIYEDMINGFPVDTIIPRSMYINRELDLD